MPLQFNVGTTNQFVTLSNIAEQNPQDAVTFEGICVLRENGQDPTIIARPATANWEPPYVVYRLGFHGSKRLPEFQLLFENEAKLTTIQGKQPVDIGKPTHLAATYNGEEMGLHVDGRLVASLRKAGKLANSNEPTVIASRSATLPGGFLIGTLEELRIWKIARTEKEIDLWKDRLLPLPAPATCVGLYPLEPSPPDDVHDTLKAQGFSQLEMFLVNFVNWYVVEYNKRAQSVLKERACTYYSDTIRCISFIKAKDGYCAFYEPTSELFKGIDSPEKYRGVVAWDLSQNTLSEVVQKFTDNRVKILSPELNKSLEVAWRFPADVPGASSAFVSPIFRDRANEIPCISIHPKVKTENDIVTEILPNRIRAISPLVQSPDGSFVRQFTWLFADFWFGELTRETVYLPAIMHLLWADLQALQWFVDLALPPELAVEDGPGQAIKAMEQLLDEFETLLDKPNIDEVRDIQPFLENPKHRILLSPQCKKVWAQKWLGNKHKVDFIVREYDDSYTAIELKLPDAPLFTKELNPRQQVKDGLQQLRDYCDYVDWNRDSVEREEGLPGIINPRGILVIGRRKELSPEAARKLASLNRDSVRHTIMTYDDLIDRARALIKSVKTLIAPA